MIVTYDQAPQPTSQRPVILRWVTSWTLSSTCSSPPQVASYMTRSQSCNLFNFILYKLLILPSQPKTNLPKIYINVIKITVNLVHALVGKCNLDLDAKMRQIMVLFFYDFVGYTWREWVVACDSKRFCWAPITVSPPKAHLEFPFVRACVSNQHLQNTTHKVPFKKWVPTPATGGNWYMVIALHYCWNTYYVNY
jgi:hypothetical protein